MAANVRWIGQLRLSLGTPVEHSSAARSGANISSRQIQKHSGQGDRYENVPCMGAVQTKMTLEPVQFFGVCEIAPIYLDKPFYLVPTDDLATRAQERPRSLAVM